MHIAVLGATSQIARNLIARWVKDPSRELSLFARRPEKVKEYLAGLTSGRKVFAAGYDLFGEKGNYDVLVNCVGIADPFLQKEAGIDLFRITEKFDEMALCYLEQRPSARYLNFSSGAVYGSSFSSPVSSKTRACIDVNPIAPVDYYRVSKLNAEAKHRSLTGACIVDIRIFSFFSRYIDLNSGFIISDMMRSLIEKREFVTNKADIIRDYIHPDDLFALLGRILLHEAAMNLAVDAYSLAPISKTDMIRLMETRYGLRVRYADAENLVNATGQKNVYYSTHFLAESFGYAPRFRSRDAIISEADAILKS